MILYLNDVTVYFPKRVRTLGLSVTDNALFSQWTYEFIRTQSYPSTCELSSNICWSPTISDWWKVEKVIIQLVGARDMTATELDLVVNNYLRIIWMAQREQSWIWWLWIDDRALCFTWVQQHEKSSWHNLKFGGILVQWSAHHERILVSDWDWDGSVQVVLFSNWRW